MYKRQAVNLAAPLARRGVKIIGTDCDAIERAENRDASNWAAITINTNIIIKTAKVPRSLNESC